MIPSKMIKDLGKPKEFDLSTWKARADAWEHLATGLMFAQSKIGNLRAKYDFGTVNGIIFAAEEKLNEVSAERDTLKARCEKLEGILNQMQNFLCHRAHCKIMNIGIFDLVLDGKKFPDCNCKLKELRDEIKTCRLDELRKQGEEK